MDTDIGNTRRIYHVHDRVAVLVGAEDDTAAVGPHCRVQGVDVHVHGQPVVEVAEWNVRGVRRAVVGALGPRHHSQLSRVRY